MPYKVFYFGPHAVSTFDLSHIAATHLQELKLHYLHTTRITTHDTAGRITDSSFSRGRIAKLACTKMRLRASLAIQLAVMF